MFTKKRKQFVLSVYLVAPPLNNFVIYPLCFTAYTYCDVMSQLSSLKGRGASDPKNPDPYYFIVKI